MLGTLTIEHVRSGAPVRLLESRDIVIGGGLPNGLYSGVYSPRGAPARETSLTDYYIVSERGSITVQGRVGDHYILKAHGDIKADSVGNDVHIHSLQGNIIIGSVSGAADLSADIGKVTVRAGVLNNVRITANTIFIEMDQAWEIRHDKMEKILQDRVDSGSFRRPPGASFSVPNIYLVSAQHNHLPQPVVFSGANAINTNAARLLHV